MKFDLNNEIDLNQFNVKVEQFKESKDKVELKKITKRRSLSQNAYVHVLFALYGIEFGYTIEEVKSDMKELCPFMNYTKNGKRYLKETRKLDKKEMTDFIEWFRNYAAKEAKFHLPSSEEYIRNKFYLERDIERFKQYL